MSQIAQSPLPAATAEPPPCAVLFIQNQRHGRNAKVYGASGKSYEFRWDPRHERLTREYRSAAVFAAEELDVRRHTQSQYVVCTLLGTPHPAAHALEAVAALIAARRQVSVPARQVTLRQIVAEATAALAALEPEEPAPAEPPAAPPARAGRPRKPVALEESLWRDGEGRPLRSRTARAGTAPAKSQPAAAGGLHTHAELMQAEWPSVKELARGLGIAPGSKGRADLVAEILAREAA